MKAVVLYHPKLNAVSISYVYLNSNGGNPMQYLGRVEMAGEVLFENPLMHGWQYVGDL